MKYVIGIDEVGRGPLAGPVTVGIVICEENFYKKLKKRIDLPAKGKDSKKLSPEYRYNYSNVLKSLKLINTSCSIFNFNIIHISNKEIDRRGISSCIKGAVVKGLKNLTSGIDKNNIKVLLDGGLKAPLEFKNQKTIIKGDEKEKIIAWSSVLAKVSRDKLMVQISKKYSEYSFEKHKGYGTMVHRNAIKKWGLSPIHRKTFCRNLI